MGDRCTGHCCRNFWLSNSQVEKLHENPDSVKNGRYIRDMLIPHYWVPIAHDDNFHFTCVWFDGVGCTAYEDRPEMCSDFPYEQDCPYRDCEWDRPNEHLVQVTKKRA